jgi:Tfp pilus assembly protein FimV
MNNHIACARAWMGCFLTATCLSALAADTAPKTYTVMTGDTIDKVIQRTMGSSPLKTEVLRQAFIQQNPQAFTKANAHYLIAGAVLKVPNQEELMMSLMAKGRSSGKGSYAAAEVNERKNWIRFP